MVALPSPSDFQRDVTPAVAGVTRRGVLAAVAAAGAAQLAAPAVARAAQGKLMLKFGHPFPSGRVESRPADFRDRLARQFADEVGRRTDGAIAFDMYPDASFTRSEASFSAVKHGALDLLLAPLTRAASDVPEAAIGTMPGLVEGYDQAARWRDAPVGVLLASALRKRGGARILSWIWTQGAIVGRTSRVLAPRDVMNLRMRGGSPPIDSLVRAAGARAVGVSGPDLHEAMQRGRIDVAIASSSSLLSYGLRDVVEALGYPEGAGPWFMLCPLMIAEPVFNKLTAEQQAAFVDAGRMLEAPALAAARADDAALPGAFSAVGVSTSPLPAEAIEAWRTLGRLSAWKEFAGLNDRCAGLLAAAQALG